MHRGDKLNGYTIVTEPTNAGGGMSQWAFAERNGTRYFIKQFLSPKYPRPEAPGGAAMKARNLELCKRFEAHQGAIFERLSQAESVGGGNLVVTRDFFLSGSSYFKVTDAIDTRGMTARHVTEHDPQILLVVLRTIARSLSFLHAAGLVHGDMKTDNILMKPTPAGATAKLIDYDNAFFSGAPVPAEEMVGDLSFAAPELFHYVMSEGDAPHMLTTAADIFSLGLVFCELVAGAFPTFPESFQYPGVAVANGVQLEFPHHVNVRAPSVPLLVNQMLRAEPHARPPIAVVESTLASLDPGGLARTLSPAAGGFARPAAPPMREPTIAETSPPAAPAPAPPSSKLKSTMGRRPVRPGHES